MATNPKIDTNDPAQVERARALVVEHLQEAHATEQALVTNLRAHIAMTPRGPYRESLERHLTETQQHERAVARRIREIGRDRGVLSAVYGAVTTTVGQALVLTKGPLDLLRGGPDGDKKLLKNARDEVATEALEIAIYDALEALALAIGDDSTARLAARHRRQEERMLEELRGHIPKLANAVVRARATGKATYEGRHQRRVEVLEAASRQLSNSGSSS
jgi:ferritin-like metal-binding protein YciE